jgi:opacity protein-like surface antigen
MKKLFLLSLVLIIPYISRAQFEQKLSLSISSGILKTLGKKLDSGDIFQMGNYKLGVYENIGLQFNLGKRFSILSEFGLFYSGKWDYQNDLHFSFEDPNNSGQSIAEGYNTLTLANMSLGVKPKIYLNPGKQLNPYLSFGLSLNFTKAVFTDNYWYTGKNLYDQGILPNFLSNEPAPYDPWLSKNTGLGFNPGAGLEYNLSDKIGFSVSAGYSLIFLNGKNFPNEKIVENLHAVSVHAGIHYNFLKSKKL